MADSNSAERSARALKSALARAGTQAITPAVRLTNRIDVPAVLDLAACRERDAGMPDDLQVAARAVVVELIDLLRVSASNVRSLGPAGGLEALPHGPYGEWLRQLDAALARVGGAK